MRNAATLIKYLVYRRKAPEPLLPMICPASADTAASSNLNEFVKSFIEWDLI
jgi:hypothetical protein